MHTHICVHYTSYIYIYAYFWYTGQKSQSHPWASVQFSHLVVSNSLRPHELQHARPPCPPPTPGVHSNLHPSSQWCHPAISSSVVPFSSCPPSLPASESFPMSQLFAWGGQSTGVSALAYNNNCIIITPPTLIAVSCTLWSSRTLLLLKS